MLQSQSGSLVNTVPCNKTPQLHTAAPGTAMKTLVCTVQPLHALANKPTVMALSTSVFNGLSSQISVINSMLYN